MSKGSGPSNKIKFAVTRFGYLLTEYSGSVPVNTLSGS